MIKNYKNTEEEILRIKKDNYEWTWVILWAVIVLLTNMSIKLGGSDDTANLEIIGSSYTWSEWVLYRYTSWSSRFVNEAIGFVMIQNPTIWKAANTIVMFAIPLLYNYLAGSSGCLAAILFMCIPLTTISEAGWISTTTGYLFIAGFALCAMSLIKLHVEKKESMSTAQTIILSVGIVLTVIMGASHELLAIIVLASIVYALCVYRQKYGHYSTTLIIAFFFTILDVVAILCAPGNANRMIQETNNWFPEFATLSFLEKVLLGVLRVFEVCIIDRNTLFFLFTTIVAIGGFAFGRTYVYKIWAMIPAVFVFVFVFFWDDFSYTEPMANVLSVKYIIFVIISDIILAGSIVGLWSITARNTEDSAGRQKGVFSIVLAVTGIGTQAALGFSPTIYASGYRTSFFMLLVFIYLILLIWNRLFCKITSSQKHKAIRVIGVLGLLICGAVYIYSASKIHY